MDEETGLYYYGARYYNPRESVWISTDPLSGYNPIFETEHYINGQHNGGVFNSFNHNIYGYTYQNPIKYIDPNGKQNEVTGGASSGVASGTSSKTTSYTWKSFTLDLLSVVGYIPRTTLGALLHSTALNSGESEWLAKRDAGIIAKAEAATKQENKSNKITLYRGVYVGHPDYSNAILGIANPWNETEGHTNPEAHNGGNFKSIFTSWTYSRAVADYHANKQGEGGVVLTKSFSPEQIIDSPDIYAELEVLVPGIVTGAKVEQPLGSGKSSAY